MTLGCCSAIQLESKAPCPFTETACRVHGLLAGRARPPPPHTHVSAPPSALPLAFPRALLWPGTPSCSLSVSLIPVSPAPRVALW